MRRRLFYFFSASLLSTFCLATASAQNPANAAKDTRYLALGDSVAFGYDPLVAPSLSNFVGYPELVSKALHRKVANASCPGESSGSFLSSSAPDLGCRFWRSLFPLFVPYSGTQMDYALTYVRNNPNLQLITINIGGNDLGLLQQVCALDVSCELGGLGGVLGNFGQNLTTILGGIRHAGYTGPVVVLNYYAFNYGDQLQVGGFMALNSYISGVAAAFGAKVADGFGAFQQASVPFNGDVCAAGLLLKLPDGTCSVHPNAAGQQLLADTIVGVVSLK